MTEEKRQLLFEGFAETFDFLPVWMNQTRRALCNKLYDSDGLNEYELEIAELIILEGYRLKGECNVQD